MGVRVRVRVRVCVWMRWRMGVVLVKTKRRVSSRRRGEWRLVDGRFRNDRISPVAELTGRRSAT